MPYEGFQIADRSDLRIRLLHKKQTKRVTPQYFHTAPPFFTFLLRVICKGEEEEEEEGEEGGGGAGAP